MKRGDIHFVGLEPAGGSEANKVRPCIIVSNDRANGAAEYLAEAF
jgi:mRNA interferase MazF